MKALTAAFLFIFLASAQAAVFERILTEENSIQTALALNYDILIQSQKAELSNQKSRESKALYFPIVDLNINISKFSNGAPVSLFNNLSASPVYLPAENPEGIYYNSRISVWQHLYTGGRVRGANRMALINIEKTKNELNIIKNKVTSDIKKAFNETLYYKTKIEVLQSSKNKKNASEIKFKIDASEIEYGKSLLNLLYLIGLDLNSIADVEGAFEPKMKDISLDKCMVLAYQYKAEFQSALYQESMDELSVNLLSVQRYPAVDIGAAQEWVGEKVLNDKNNWYVFLNINLPVFDGGAVISRVAQAKVNARQAAIERAKNNEQIRLFIHQSFLEYSFWKQKAVQNNLLSKRGRYDENDLEIIRNLNRSYFDLEFATGVQLDKF
ncbi:MAG: TolC family protein [Elusimicrobiota bacterium]|nr:TolC family protein [Elusimicrobiota bacterium]